MLWRQRWRRVVAVRSKRCVTTLWAIITAGCRVSWSDCEIPRHAGKNMLEYYWLDQTAGTRPRLHTVLRNGCMLVVMPCIQSMSTRSIALRLHIDLNPRRMIHQTKQAGTHLASRPSLRYKYGLYAAACLALLIWTKSHDIKRGIYHSRVHGTWVLKGVRG